MRIREAICSAVIASGCALALATVLPQPAAMALSVLISVVIVFGARRFGTATSAEDASVPLANISHEIRTPLNGILGLTQLLLRMQPAPQQREYLEAIRSSGQSLLRLMNDILDYSKIRSGALVFEREEFRVRKRVREIVRGLAPQAHLSGLELAFWVEPDVPQTVVGDPNRLGQVLTNLLVNAIKFTRKGEVALTVSLERRDPETATLRFRVSDTGVGVPVEQRTSIFEAFAQAAPRHREPMHSIAQGGVGLGLAIARELVERMDGEIGLEAPEGGGSIFYFTSCFELGLDGAVGDDEAPSDALAGFSVLVIDDSRAQRRALEKQMTAWGFDVAVACDEATALERIERQRPFSFLLVDSHMPGVDTWGLARKLQARNRVPAVLMTLAHEHVDTEILRAHGFVGYLSKPVAPTHLLRAFEIIRRGATVETPEDVQTQNMDRLALGGIRVLLAEDHPVNRTVVVAMLERIGCEIAAVANGRHALELLNREQFDLALLDVQMPEVDGLALAGAIRARGGNGDALPLIAVTAHARESDREKCRHAGMDAFLSKPFQEEELVSMMRRCLASPRERVSVPRFDRPVALARANGDAALLAELSVLFLQETPKTLAAIERALSVHDLVSVERLAHRLKGSLLTLAAERAAALALDLETMARSRPHAECEAALQDLSSELSLLTPELEAMSESVKSS
jgi:CheY-like chemotaxis protein